MLNEAVPWRMQWGRSRGKYPGQHIVRKLLLKYEAEIGEMCWCRESILEVGPDRREYLQSLLNWSKPKLISEFSPLPPSRLSMWGCLMGQAFKLTPQAKLLWQSDRVPVDMFRRHAEQLKESSGVTPHVKQVWDSIVAEFASGDNIVDGVG